MSASDTPAATASDRRRVLVLCGGADYAHDFTTTGPAIADLVEHAGHAAVLVAHPDAAADELATGTFDALVVNALWWRMEADAYAPWRDEWAYVTPDTTRATIESFVHAGGGLLANHTAPICFDDWPEWSEIVGATWRWGISSHPPHGPVTARVVADHPVVADLPAEFALVDEVYGDMLLGDDVEVLAVAKRTPDDADQPVVWAHRYGAGRVVFDGFGHDADTIRHPANAVVLTAGLSYVLRET